MDKTVELIPAVGAVLDGGTVCLGSTRAEVEETLGSPETARWNCSYYFANELRVDFDGDGRVEFIELLGGPEGMLQPIIFGLNAFQEPPETVAALLKEKNGADLLDTEEGILLCVQEAERGAVPGEHAGKPGGNGGGGPGRRPSPER